MKVKDLIELLKEQNPNDEVLLSCDSEGNEFKTLDEGVASYKKCVVLYPTDTVIDLD